MRVLEDNRTDSDIERYVGDIVPLEDKILASSEKLCRASPVFNRMLDGTFKEGAKLRDDGHVEIYPPDDPDYLAFLLDAIHSRGVKGVPFPSRMVLAGLCSLIDNYFLHAGLAKSLAVWLKAFRPKRFSNNTEFGEVLFIDWVARQAASLSSGMREAVYNLRSPIKQDQIQLPLPMWIIGKSPGFYSKLRTH